MSTDIWRRYVKICESFGLPRNHARQVVREIESHTGLIVEVAFEVYEFAHKAIQEYLAAEFILRLPSHPRDLSLSLPNEMALATAMSSDSTRYFCAVIDSAIASDSSSDLVSFTSPFLRRLLLEKIDFKTDKELGYSVVVLYSETFFLGRQLRLPFAVESDSFSEFLKMATVRASIYAIIQSTQIRQHPDETLEITWPDEQRKLSKRRCIVDRSFIEQSGMDERFLSMHNTPAPAD